MSWELPEPPRDEDEPYDESGDREPRKPKYPPREGGAALEVPKEEELICCQR